MTGSGSRRQIGPAPVTLLLLALILLLAPPAFANVGVPILTLVWPVAWLLLLVIIPIEASVAQRVLGTDPARSIELAVRANLVSTALGIPLTWGWLSSLGMQDVSLRGILDLIGVRLSANERDRLWLALAVAALVCVPCFLMSVGCEYLFARLSLNRHPWRQVGRWAWRANALSYIPVFLFYVLYFNYAASSWYSMDLKVWSAICLSNEKQIGLAIHQYRQEHADRIPPARDFAELAALIKPYLKHDILLHCRATGKGYQFNTALSGVKGSSIKNPEETPMVSDALPHGDGMIRLLCADGRAKAARVTDPSALGGQFR